jgi:hypothetical protein
MRAVARVLRVTRPEVRRPPPELKAGIRQMAPFWGCTGADLDHALRRAAEDPDAWLGLLINGERWRASQATGRLS